VGTASRRLRELLQGPGLLVAPGVTNALHARLVQQAGFPLLFTSGAGIANTLLGLPDLGLTTMSEIVTVTRRIVEAVSVPVVADADNGYGNHLNVTRMVREMEAAGVAGLYMEDQVSPKRCGHFKGKQVVPPREMVEKIVALRMAVSDPDFVLVARTDAIATEGIDSALARGRLYVDAGADVIFVEAPRTVEEMALIPPAVSVPCLINVVEGGATPLLPAAELERMGFRIALYANLALRAGALATAQALRRLRDEGTSAGILDSILPWEERQRLVDLPGWEELDRKISEAADEIVVRSASYAAGGKEARR